MFHLCYGQGYGLASKVKNSVDFFNVFKISVPCFTNKICRIRKRSHHHFLDSHARPK